MKINKKIIVAIDETSLIRFKEIVDSLDSDICMIKIGGVAFNTLGHEVIIYVFNKLY